MKIVSYRYKNQKSYGVLTAKSIANLPCLAMQSGETLPETVENFVIAGENAIQKAEKLMTKAESNCFVPLTEVSLLAPIMFPPKIVCLGVNYRDHAAETGAEIPKEPILFMKPRTALIGPNEKIMKSFVKHLDYEGELAIIIGKKAKNVSMDEAKEYIFGYTILNDISAREIQYGDKQWTRGKSFDTFAPIGPCITTESQLKDIINLIIRTWVNNELRQNGTTRNMVFNVEQIIHRLSQVMTLEPCDIIATGTPAGVGVAMKPEKWLKSGDIVTIEIEGIGVLQNTVE
ncbi:MAG TPA: fumarylacetoacetate hydrolase family protein [Candidatus Sulfotelmatobacter sp.]|nr:fumarylacetoacetate hydrolase family protein [Candidatus Sulfotelmatobacter sp.]